MSLFIEKKYSVIIVFFENKKMEYVTVAGPFLTMKEAERTLQKLQTEISVENGVWSISENINIR